MNENDPAPMEGNRMSWSREGDEVVLRMSQDTWNRLIHALGMAAGAARQMSRNALYDQLRLVNKLNEGNPRFKPYEVPDEGELI